MNASTIHICVTKTTRSSDLGTFHGIDVAVGAELVPKNPDADDIFTPLDEAASDLNIEVAGYYDEAEARRALVAMLDMVRPELRKVVLTLLDAGGSYALVDLDAPEAVSTDSPN